MKQGVFTSVLLYCCGFVTAANCSLLLPQARNYDAHWWKAIAASGFAVALIYAMRNSVQNFSDRQPPSGGDYHQ